MQNNLVKISVIMPVYNVSAYLEKAINSVLEQSLNDFEFFLVDDGSTDNSGEICDKYAKLDDRIIVIHQNNAGAHNARNNALKIAKGEYVCFFDSDDFVDKNMLKDLYELAKDNDSDLVISGFYINTYYDNDNYIVLNYIPYTENGKEVECFNDSKVFRKLAYKNFDRNMFYSPWNKLYKLSYLKERNITFPITYRDDFPFVLSVIRDIQNVVYTKKQYYCFIRKRTESETQKYVANFYSKREEEHKEMLDIYEYWGLIEDKPSFEMISRRYIDRIIECMVNMFNSECKLTKKEKKETIKSYISTDYFNKSIKAAKPQRLYLKLMYIPLKLRSVLLCYTMSQFIYYVKRRNIKLFSTLKTNR